VGERELDGHEQRRGERRKLNGTLPARHERDDESEHDRGHRERRL
jgi:hypothetical protein